MRRRCNVCNRHVRSRIEDVIFIHFHMTVSERTRLDQNLHIADPVVTHACQAVFSGLQHLRENSVSPTSSWRDQTWRPVLYSEDYVRAAPAINPQRQLKPA